MAAKVFVALCASILLVQTISAQCIGNRIAEEIALGRGSANGLPYGAASWNNPSASGYGCGFPVTSSSAIAPTGIRVVSENAIEGALNVAGELPFLSAIAVEGSLPSLGAGVIDYGCGNGVVGIVSEGIAPAYGPAAAAVGPSRYGYGPGFAGPGVASAGFAGPGFGYNGFSGYGVY